MGVKTLVLVAATVLAVAPALSQEPQPNDAARNALRAGLALDTADAQLEICKQRLSLWRTRVRSGTPQDSVSDFSSCIKNAEEDSQTLLARLNQLAPSDGARAAVQDWHIAYVTALRGIWPEPGESVSSHASRQGSLASQLTQTRLKAAAAFR